MRPANPREQYVYPGRLVDIFTMGPENVDIETIAHSLALQNRWRGMTREPFSVAQHSVLVSQYCSPEHALWGLLHDAAEAYVGDQPGPVKGFMRFEFAGQYCDFSRLEGAILNRIAVHRGLANKYGEAPTPDEVATVDARMLATEARDLLIEGEWDWRSLEAVPFETEIVPWGWQVAERRFMKRFRELTA